MDLEETASNNMSNSWKGVSLTELYLGKGPWTFGITPVSVSKYHAVLYKLPVNLKECPKPHTSRLPNHWDENHVRMPYSEKNLYPVIENGKQTIKNRWVLIKDSLCKLITNSRDLEKAIKSYNTGLPSLEALHYFFEEVVEEEEASLFFENVFPKIVKLALSLPEIIPGSLPLLKKGYNRSVSLSQVQISCILANAFLCTFPWRKDMAGSYPGINFTKLFAAHARREFRGAVAEKLKCLFHYFRRVTENVPVGVITFERKFKPKANMYRWDSSELNMNNTKVHINSEGTIEDDGLGFLQVDFANKNVGGGVLGYGCVQEEIRFVICPELLASRLFVERLGDQEAVTVTGCERYSNYSGYSNTFTWEGDHKDQTPYDEYGRRRTTICIIDATYFSKQMDQFYPSAMLRELNKAYVGFNSRIKEKIPPVATGNWGCGAFNGSTLLKSLLQLMVCTAAERHLVYYTFGDEELRDKFYDMYIFLISNSITIGSLWRFLCGFSTQKISENNLYSYIQQAFFDSRKQPKIKKFFPVNFKKKDNERPSTSKERTETESKSSNEPLLETEKKMESDFSSFDDDIIPPTPPEYNRFKKMFSKNKSKLTNEEVVQKLPKTSIIELIDSIDETARAKTTKEESFLSYIDNVSKKIKISTSDEESPEIIETSQDLEYIPESFTKSNLNVSANASTTSVNSTKRLISDYFQNSFKSS